MFLRTWWEKIAGFLVQTYRVLLVTRKPSAEEFKMIAKITGLGIAIIGSIGFVLQILKQLLFT